MSLATGTRLGVYEIVAPLGAGGMGEVYRARDTKLGREVAVKVLSEAFTQHPEKLARFEREAKLLAALNHPGIATLHGFEKSEGKPFLVMELVEGETLAERISRGAIPSDEALRISMQIAEALEAAHEKRVIHRDLKPANIKVDTEGNVKVLDFGLAKALEDERPDTELSQSPTLSRDATRAGVILGTAAYMSPEQAKGRAIDERTDVFSYGVVLYEMLTGNKAFAGEDVSDVLAAIIKEEPGWRALPSDVPPSVVKLLRRCLTKDRKNRLQAIGDARVEIHEVLADPNGSSAAARPTSAWPQKVIWSGVGALVAAIVAVVLRPPAEVSSPVRFTMTLPEICRLSGSGRRVVALSPNGRKLAYTANDRIRVRDMARLEADVLSGTDGARDLAFSPDGQWIAFWNRGGLQKVAVSGGASITLCSAHTPYGVGWDTDGTIFYGQGPEGIYRVSADGGEPEQVVVMEPGEEAGFPQLLPEEDSLLFTLLGGVAGDGVIMTQSLATGERQAIFRGGRGGRYLRTGHLVSAVGANLQAVPFDLARMEATGAPVALFGGVRASAGGTNYTVSESGSLAYIADQGNSTQLFWTDRQGVRTPVGAPVDTYDATRLSPDGTRIALELEGDIWIYDISRSTMERLTFTGAFNPLWAEGGKSVIYASGAGIHQIFSKRADGSGEAEPLTTGEQDSHPHAVSLDGSALAFQAFTESTDSDIWILPKEGQREPRLFLRTEFREYASAFSPDGRWLAFTSNQSGQPEVYVTSYPGPGARIRISTNGGFGARWSRDGSEIFYLEGNAIMSVAVAAGSQPSFGTPRKLFEASLAGNPSFLPSYTPMLDGSGFLIAESTSGGLNTIQIVLDWFVEVERLVPTE